jgi:hypothetical protein
MMAAQLAFWWILVPLSAEPGIPLRIVLSLSLPITPFVLVLWLLLGQKSRRLARDSTAAELHVVASDFRKCWQASSGHVDHNGPAFPAKEQEIKVDGMRLTIPVETYLALPKEGKIQVEYFPNSRLVWRIDGRLATWR